MTNGKARKQWNGIEKSRFFCSFSQRECKWDQDDQTCIKEDRDGNDKTGETERPGCLFVAELLNHSDCKCLGAARDLQNRSKHGPETYQQGNAF